LRFTSETEFGYADNRNVIGIEKMYDHCLMVFFGPVPSEGDPDSIAFTAIGV
jgi:hypothetical protein